MSGKAVFLDKDGTLVDDLPYNVDPRRVALCRGAPAALRRLAQDGYRFFVVSNQPGVAHGRFDEAALRALGQHLAALLGAEQIALAGWYYCPHHPDGTRAPYARACACRKPAPGMLLRAAAEHDIELAASWMIGDILHDVEAGNRAGCRTLLLDNGNETAWQPGRARVPSLVARDWAGVPALIAQADAARAARP